MMPIPYREIPFPAIFCIIIFLSISILSPLFVTANDISVLNHPSKLHLPLGQPVEDSPGSRPGSIITCNRIHIHGRSRLRNPEKFAHALKVKFSVSQVGDSVFRSKTVEICSHRNASLKIGMCPAGEWQKLSKGSWVQFMSPFGDKILDIRALPDPSRSIELSTEEEFLFHRVVFLVVGLVMMVTARIISESVVFYYGSAMAIGVILVILMVLFQGMKLLPTGRKSSLAIFMYSTSVGVATFLLRYLSGFLRSILSEMGINEDMQNLLGIFLLASLVLAGAWCGYWGVRKLVLAEDGLVDSSVSYFVEWAILIFAAVMVLQSSLDTLLATVALSFAIIIAAITRTHGKSRFLRRLIRRMVKRMSQICDYYSHAEQSWQFNYRESESPAPQAKHFNLGSCSTKTSPAVATSEGEGSYYSTFHNTPGRKKFSKGEWEIFTKEGTKKALKELVSSPDFNQWAVANAERIMVTPPDYATRAKQQRRFRWF